jgi:hypothetical protein
VVSGDKQKISSPCQKCKADILLDVSNGDFFFKFTNQRT